MSTAAKAFDLAREQYAALGVDAEKVLHTALETPISMHCWQGVDVLGFRNSAEEMTRFRVQSIYRKSRFTKKKFLRYKFNVRRCFSWNTNPFGN